MREAFEARLSQLLRVPPAPEPPRGDPESLRIFRAAPGFLRYRLLSWGMSQLGPIVGLLFVLRFSGSVFGFVEELPVIGAWTWTLYAFEAMAVGFFVAEMLLTLLMVPLDYKYRWYMITDRSLRIREGLVKTQERTMTFLNLQNVSIRQGPLQRFFGIADLEVRTAGGGGNSSGSDQHGGLADNLHVGYFRGVANAGEIRDAILEHLRKLRASDLGDPDERQGAVETAAMPAAVPAAMPAARPADDGRELLAAGQQMLQETRTLAALLAKEAR